MEPNDSFPFAPEPEPVQSGKRSSRSTVIAIGTRLITIAGLSALFSAYWIPYSASQYQEWQTITEESYLAQFEEHKAELLEDGRISTNLPLAHVAAVITMALLVGSYELIVFVIGYLLKTLIRE